MREQQHVKFVLRHLPWIGRELLKLQNPIIGIACAGVLWSLIVAGAWAQSYPEKPIRFVMPFPAGGGGDILGRLISPQAAQSLGQPIVIDNRGGAGGNIGIELVAHSVADGYTILMGSAALPINATLYRKLKYDSVKDFATVTLLAKSPNLLMVNPSLSVKSVKDLIALAKSAPGTINYASGGSGTTPHLAAELFKKVAEIDLVHVPYKGTAPALIAVIGGEASLILPPALTGLPFLKNGKLKALAITSIDRAEALPDLPTVDESGLAGFEATQWYGVLVPSATPAVIVDRLNREFVKVMQTTEVKTKLLKDASIPIGSTSQKFASYLKEEFQKWAAVVTFSGARAD